MNESTSLCIAADRPSFCINLTGMKKLLFTIFSITSMVTYAQEPADALRFSWTVPAGTARQQAIGGAMGSLGGDLTATFVNPAGLGFYKTGDFVVSPMYRFGKTKSNYFDHKESEKEGKIDLGTTGFVIGSGSRSGNVRSHVISIAFNTTGNFRNDILYRGINNQSSYSQKYIEELMNYGQFDSTITYLFPFGSSLAFNTYWIDPQRNSAGEVIGFTTNSPVGTGVIQEQKITNRGGVYEGSLAFAANIKDKLMVGGSLSVPYTYFRREASFSEADATTDNTNNFDFAKFEETLTTSGLGANLKLGLIYKPQEYWRLGLALHSPTFFSLTDKYEAQLTANTEAHAGTWTDYSLDYTGGNPSEFKYFLLTPYKVIGSVSYVLREIEDVTKQRGFLTADVEYVNHRASSYSPDSENENDESTKDYLKQLNKAIDNAYKGAFNFKVGGELKFTTLMVRLGAAYYGNPYKNINGEKGHKLNLSGGLGYRNKGKFIDLTYVHNMTKDVHTPYRLQNNPYSSAELKGTTGNVVLTFGIKI